jgi:multidrug resistance efflux pump
MKEIVNCGRMERFQIIWKMIKQTYYRQQLHKARNRIAQDEEKIRHYEERINSLSRQLDSR